MPKKISRMGMIFLALLCLILLIITVFEAYTLFSKSYYIKEAGLVKLDTIQVFGKVYITTHSSRSKDAGFEFQSTAGHYFDLKAEWYYAIADIKKLINTLQSPGIRFTAYTDQKGIERYTAGGRASIHLYQLLIDGKKYIDIEKANGLIRRNLIWRVIFLSAFFACLAFALYKNRPAPG